MIFMMCVTDVHKCWRHCFLQQLLCSDWLQPNWTWWASQWHHRYRLHNIVWLPQLYVILIVQSKPQLKQETFWPERASVPGHRGPRAAEWSATASSSRRKRREQGAAWTRRPAPSQLAGMASTRWGGTNTKSQAWLQQTCLSRINNLQNLYTYMNFGLQKLHNFPYLYSSVFFV